MAVTFVHRGHGLIVVIKPKIKAVSTGKVLVDKKVCKNSITFYLLFSTPHEPKSSGRIVKYDVFIFVFEKNVVVLLLLIAKAF